MSQISIHVHLNKTDLDRHRVAKYAAFVHSLSNEAANNPQLRDSLKQTFELVNSSQEILNVLKDGRRAASAAKYLGTLNKLVQESGLSAKTSIANVIVHKYSAIAKSQGVQLNECALSVAKVALDIGGAGVEAVGSVAGVGIPLLLLSMLSTYQDAQDLVTSCTPK